MTAEREEALWIITAPGVVAKADRRGWRAVARHDGKGSYIVVCISASTHIAWPLIVRPNGLARYSAMLAMSC